MDKRQIEAALEKWFISEEWDIEVSGDRFAVKESNGIEINLTELAKFIMDESC